MTTNRLASAFAQRLSDLPTQDRTRLVTAYEHFLAGRIQDGFAQLAPLAPLPDIHTAETLQQTITDTVAAIRATQR